MRVQLRLQVWDLISGFALLSAVVGGLPVFGPDGANVANGQESIRPNRVRSLPLLPDRQVPAPSGEELPAAAVARLGGHQSEAFRIAYSPDQKTVLTGGLDGGLGWWVVPTGVNRRLKEVWGGAVQALAVSRNGEMVATGQSVGCVHLWNLRTGVRIRALSIPNRTTGVKGLAFSPDDGTIAVAAESCIRFCEVRSGEETRCIDSGD